MRHLVIILMVVVGLAATSMGDDLFLVTVVKVDRDQGTVSVRIADSTGPVVTPESAGSRPLEADTTPGAAGTTEQNPEEEPPATMTISSRALADTVHPGQVMRVWGDRVPGESVIMMTRNSGVLPVMMGDDFSGVRKRLKKSLGMPMGRMGMGHGKP